MSAGDDATAARTSRRRLGRGASTIVVLALTSLFTDVSSDMTVNVPPIYLTSSDIR